MDRNIDERIRKPRRVRGTPANKFLNIVALGGFIFGGVCWYLFELWPEAKKFKKKQLEGKFDFSPETKAYIETLRTGTEDPILEDVLAKIKKRQEDKNSDELWFVKLTKSKPDI